MIDVSKNVQKLLSEIRIFDVAKQKIRIGCKADGGYIALDEICKNSSCLLSFGVEDNVTFELDFVEKYPQAHVLLFDHTVDSLPSNHDNFTFKKKGIGPKTQGDIISLSSVIASAGSGLTLKMDIEWDEWKTLAALEDKHFENIDQLLIEFHFAFIDTTEKFIPNKDPSYKLTPYFCNFYKSVYDKINHDLLEEYFDLMNRLNEKFYAFHIHPNNSLKKVSVGNSTFPPLLEISFVRKQLISTVEETKQKFPVDGLDFPNKSYKEELQDYYPLT